MVKQWLLAHKKLHLWLAAELALLGAFFLLRGNRALMNVWTTRVTTPIKRALGGLCDGVPFSVMEVLILLLAAGLLVYLAVWTVRLLRSPNRGRTVYSGILGLLCAGLTLYGGVCLLWGANYQTDSFQEQSGLYARPATVEELRQVTAYFAHRLSETAETVARDETGGFAVPRAEIFAGSNRLYDGMTAYPFLDFPDRRPKPVHFSKVMSALNFTGVYCPFTGETNVNADSPACLLPATIAHELAHQRGIASEQECNFIAIRAATTCGDPTAAYSGWLLGYIYLGNALYTADVDAWREVAAGLPPSVRLDLQTNNDYWAQYEGVTARVSQKVYDGFLKGCGDELGVKSYGTVVDLLIAAKEEFAL
ncbi:MAG: DUF3810 domain-containing protein [Oscillospiraceae bacterium]